VLYIERRAYVRSARPLQQDILPSEVGADVLGKVASTYRYSLFLIRLRRQDLKNYSEIIDVTDYLKRRWQSIEPISFSGTVIELENAFIFIKLLVLSTGEQVNAL
jgi:hypothetical protein